MWISLTIFAAFMQTFRNALQSKMSANVSSTGTTLARFIFAGPIVVLYMLFLYIGLGYEFILPSAKMLPYAATTAVFQIMATVLMVKLFQQQNYAVGAGLAKSEALAAAILGFFFFGSQLSLLGALGVFLGFIAVFIMSIKGKSGRPSAKTVLLGVSCGTSFAIGSLMVREASIHSGLAFPLSAAWTLLIVITMQVISLCLFLRFKEPKTVPTLFKNWKKTMMVSLTSALGSIGWFSAMALMDVAYVKTLGQIEVLFTIILAKVAMSKKTSTTDYIGLALIGISSVMVMMPVH